MFGKFLRCLLLCASFNVVMSVTASGSVIPSLGGHREDVDETRYPWSAIGKLYNETGGWCSGVAISVNKILTAAHCLFNYRAQRFISADALHFLLGYRSGRYAVHARVASYEIGAGFNPLRYDETSDADWAILTITENLPADISPLRLSQNMEPSGTKAIIAGYPQDRAHAMTADGDCELRKETDDGRLFLHTCRGIGGYSGAPILVSAGGNEMQIAGIQIAKFKNSGTEKMIAVTAQSIWLQGRSDTRSVEPVSDSLDLNAGAKCHIPSDSIGVAILRLADIGLEAQTEKSYLPLAILTAIPRENYAIFSAISDYRPVMLPMFLSRRYRTGSELPTVLDGFSSSSQFSSIGSVSASSGSVASVWTHSVDSWALIGRLFK